LLDFGREVLGDLGSETYEKEYHGQQRHIDDSFVQNGISSCMGIGRITGIRAWARMDALGTPHSSV
jgi:hypothetical protein